MHGVCERGTKGKRSLTSVWNCLKGVVSDKVERYQAGADIFYNAVYYFGQANFEKSSPVWCQCMHKEPW